MPQCQICNSHAEPFLSFGEMPIANGFLSEGQFADEFYFNLEVGVCSSCAMVQLMELVERERMFNENYAFFSSTSSRMSTHFRQLSMWLRETYLENDNPFVVEMGSNDGILLKNFVEWGTRHLGVEPSENVADVARENGVNTECRFFDEDYARDVVDRHGQADAFIGANVLCHIPSLDSVALGLKTLLKPKGVAVFEDPYLGDILDRTSYDQIYDEHVFLYSVHAVQYLFQQYGMEVVNVQPQVTHGGSMRYFCWPSCIGNSANDTPA